MTTTEAAAYLGINPSTLYKATQHGKIAFGTSSNGGRNYSKAQLDRYARERGITIPGTTPKAQPTRQPKRQPGSPTKAQELASLLAQMQTLAAQAEALAADMLPAQAEYAFRLVWDACDADHRALLVAFVDTQVKARRKAAG